MSDESRPAMFPNAESTEFVVATRYAPEILDRMNRVADLAADTEKCEPLGLTLIKPKMLAGQADALADKVEQRVQDDAKLTRPLIQRVLPLPGRPAEGLTVTEPQPSWDATAALDHLMFCLRYDLACSYDGWVPVMGKNRTLLDVNGVPHIDPGSISYPESATAGEFHRSSEADLGEGVRVGICDTDLYPHWALTGSYFARPDDLLPEAPAQPYRHPAGHATFIAGLINAQAPGAELVVRQALDNERARTKVWDLAGTMLEFRNLGVQILNISLGCYTPDGQPPMVLQRVVEILGSDIVIVAAAGNHGIQAENDKRRPGVTEQSAFWPAALDGVVAVGASAHMKPDEQAPWSPKLPWIEFMDAGDEIVSTYLKGDVEIPHVDDPRQHDVRPFDGYARWSGTSFASATVSGRLAALMKPGVSARAALTELRSLAQHKSAGDLRLL